MREIDQNFKTVHGSVMSTYTMKGLFAVTTFRSTSGLLDIVEDILSSGEFHNFDLVRGGVVMITSTVGQTLDHFSLEAGRRIMWLREPSVRSKKIDSPLPVLSVLSSLYVSCPNLGE